MTTIYLLKHKNKLISFGKDSNQLRGYGIGLFATWQMTVFWCVVLEMSTTLDGVTRPPCKIGPSIIGQNSIRLSNQNILFVDGQKIYQFGISKMVGPKKQDFWPRSNILEGNVLKKLLSTSKIYFHRRIFVKFFLWVCWFLAKNLVF